MKTLKAILGNQFICKDEIQDIKSGTDFLVLEILPFRVGVRLRRYKFFANPEYRCQFTIRWERPSGVPTEIHKIRDGLVDYILYGFINKDETKIIQYFIGNLKVFRRLEPEPVAVFPNDPLDSWLAVYELNQFPPEFILKQWLRGDQ